MEFRDSDESSRSTDAIQVCFLIIFFLNTSSIIHGIENSF